MAILHPQECYLLELFSSPEHYAATRDALIHWQNEYDAALTRLRQDYPVPLTHTQNYKFGRYIISGGALPTINHSAERYSLAYLQRISGNPEAFRQGGTTSGYLGGLREWNDLRDDWMTDAENTRTAIAEHNSSRLEQQLSTTVNGMWQEGDLTYLGPNSLYSLQDLPKRLPRYELDTSVRIEIGELPTQTGIYLPDVEFASAQLLYPDVENPREDVVIQGVKRKDWVNPRTGKRLYSWQEDDWVQTGWTLIRRVEDEYIDVPPEGFFPNGTPEELYSWPEREKNYFSR